MTRTYREIKRQNVVEDELESKVTGREGEKGVYGQRAGQRT